MELPKLVPLVLFAHPIMLPGKCVLRIAEWQMCLPLGIQTPHIPCLLFVVASVGWHACCCCCHDHFHSVQCFSDITSACGPMFLGWAWCWGCDGASHVGQRSAKAATASAAGQWHLASRATEGAFDTRCRKPRPRGFTAKRAIVDKGSLGSQAGDRLPITPHHRCSWPLLHEQAVLTLLCMLASSIAVYRRTLAKPSAAGRLWLPLRYAGYMGAGTSRQYV